MGNNWYVDYLVEIRRRQEEVALAQRERLAKQVAEASGERPSLFQRSLNGLGTILVDWGYRLQARSGKVDFNRNVQGLGDRG